MNPFITAGYSGPDYFCDREQETEKLIDALLNGRNITLISPRRLGKTGLIHHVFHRMQTRDSKVRCFYIDIFNTQNQADFISRLGSHILGKLDNLNEKVMAQISSFLRNCRPQFTLDAVTGQPSVSLRLEPTELDASLEEILQYLDQSGYECYVAIDEFQQITQYPEKGMEALLRSLIQFTPHVHYIFAGSRQHLMSEIFSAPQRPFYQSTQKMGLEPLAEGTYYAFANQWFLKQGRTLPQTVFHRLYSVSHGITWYVQDLLNRLYAQEGDITELLLQQILHNVVQEEDVTCKNYCDMLSKGQVRLLRALAKEDIVSKPFEQQFMVKHHLSAVSSIRISLQALIETGMILKEDAGYSLSDRYFSLWLSGNYS